MATGLGWAMASRWVKGWWLGLESLCLLVLVMASRRGLG